MFDLTFLHNFTLIVCFLSSSLRDQSIWLLFHIETQSSLVVLIFCVLWESVIRSYCISLVLIGVRIRLRIIIWVKVWINWFWSCFVYSGLVYLSHMLFLSYPNFDFMNPIRSWESVSRFENNSRLSIPNPFSNRTKHMSNKINQMDVEKWSKHKERKVDHLESKLLINKQYT